MSTVFSPTPASVGLADAASSASPARHRSPFTGSRGLAALLLAAAVAALVLVADRLIGTWADEHVLLGWMALWAVVFAGTALFGGTARRLAAATLRSLGAWGRAVAEARTELRQWNRIRNNPALMAEWAQSHQADGAAGWGRFPERLADGRSAQTHLNHP